MPTTRDEQGRLTIGGASLDALARDPAIGTPSYVYDLSAMAREARELGAAFDGDRHLVAYAVKANSAGPVVRALVAEGCGADVVSGAELVLALASGVAPDRIVYSGVAKTDEELDRAMAAGPLGISAIQVESVEEIPRVEARARAAGRVARISIRVNPAVDLAALDTHAHIATGHDEAKFGVAIADVPFALEALKSAPHTRLVGFSVHVGSQFTQIGAYVDAARALFRLVAAVRAEKARDLAFVDTGGGFGIDYGGGEGCARPSDFVRAARAEQRAARLADLALHVEPGRSLVASHGVLVSRVIQAKRAPPRHWLMIDAGMNDLIRPALYQARHRIVGLDAPSGASCAFRVVGPVCESSDDFGAHPLADPPPAFVAILDCGAYGYTMASAYNGRPLPAEVFLEGGRVVDVRARGSLDRWVAERVSGNGPLTSSPARG
jgi:diaminopimelate decarboxylase